MLMMGGLSPGLKRHSVSLFEGALILREAPVSSACKLLDHYLHESWLVMRCCAQSAGGRVTGANSIAEMIRELRHSVDAKLFEGEMTQLSDMARQASTCVAAHWWHCNDVTWSMNAMNRALARTLEMAQRLATAEHDVELLRKESLNSLSRAAARRVLEQSYTAVLAMAPLPGPPLPLSAASGAHRAHLAHVLLQLLSVYREAKYVWTAQ